MKPNARVLGVYLGGVFLGALDNQVLGPVFHPIAVTFGVSIAWTAWTITAYTIAYVASTVLAGAAGDRLGRRRLFAFGMLSFGVASALAAAAPSFWVFVLARVVQGAGAGAVFPNAQAEGVAVFPAERRGTALGIFGAVFGLASIIGPNVGGALGQFLGWRSIFMVNVPIALGILAFVPGLPAGRGGRAALPDWIGGLSFAGCLGSALLCLAIPGPWRWLAGGAAAALLLAFLRRESGARVPFLDRAQLATRSGAALVGVAALIGLDLSAAVFVPLLTQRVFGFSVLGSGVALMPAAFSGAILAGVGGVLVDRIGPRAVLRIGLLAAVAGGVLLAWPALTFAVFVVAMLALGLATAFTIGAPLNRMALALYRDERAGEAFSLVAVFRAVGLAAGPVLLTLAQTRFGFTGMFGTVAVASLVALGVLLGVPDVRPAPRPRRRAAS